MKSRCLFLVLLSFMVIYVDGQSVILCDGDLNKSLYAAPDPDVAPGGNFDLSIWSLQLPTGSGTSPTTIPPAGLVGADGYTDSDYFYTDKTDGAMTFMDPQQGIATSGSLHCRTELREMTSNGSAAAWLWNGTNTITVAGEVMQVGDGTGGHVVLGQVFNSSDNIPLCEFEYDAGINGFKVLYEEIKGNGSYIDLNAPCALNTRYVFSLSMSNGVLIVSVNGNQVYSRTPGFSGKQFYFKCGCYDQTATAGSPAALPYTTVKICSLNVYHENVAATLQPSLQRTSGQRVSFTEGMISLPGVVAFIDAKGRIFRNADVRKQAALHQGFYITKFATGAIGTAAFIHERGN